MINVLEGTWGLAVGGPWMGGATADAGVAACPRRCETA